jgi:hypothetical protein
MSGALARSCTGVCVGCSHVPSLPWLRAQVVRAGWTRREWRLRRESNPPKGDRQSPNVTRRIRKHREAGGPHGDSNPDLTRCKRGVFPLDDEPSYRDWRGRLDSNQQPRPFRAVCSAGLNYSPMLGAGRGNRTPLRRFGRPGSETIGRRHARGAMTMKNRGTEEPGNRGPPGSGGGRALAGCAPPPSPHTTPVPSSLSISPVQYT